MRWVSLAMGIPSGPGFTANGYFYGVSDLVNMWWGDAKYTFNGPLAPFIALQGGTESNAGQSVHREDQQPGLRRPDRRHRREELPADRRLRSDSVEDRYRHSAQERNLQQLQLSDLGQGSDARVFPPAQRRAVLYES